MTRTILALVVLTWAPFAAAAELKPATGVANRVTEWSFTSNKAYADPCNDVELDVLFINPDGAEQRVPAFWGGGLTWKVRYAAPEPGNYRLRTVCTDADNKDLHGATGTLDVKAYEGDNPLYRHGPVRVAADKKRFEHADGTPFFWLGDTWWMGFTHRLKWPEDFHALTKDRVEKGFTVVQIVAGLYPDMPAFDPRGENEAGFPWEKDYARINPAYFDAADRRIAHLADSGLAPCIVGAWGYHLPWLGVEKMKKHWRNVIARYGAYPVLWCTAGEGIMPYYLSQDRAKDIEFQKKGWTEIARFIHATDPFRRPVSIHPTDLARNQVEDPTVLDFEMLQTGHGDRASIPPTISLVKASRTAQPTMPTINSEVCYEGILGTCHEEIQRFMAWSCLLSGTAGHTYGANGIWQVNGRDVPYGPSPHGGNWGNTPWDEAAALPGSGQTGLAKKTLEKLGWHQFEPHPEWAAFDEGAANEPYTWGDWIWFPEGEPSANAPVAKRFFRKTFDLPEGAKVARAVLDLSVDDKFTAFVNGRRVGGAHSWEVPQRHDVTALIKPGKNVVAIEAENVAAPVPANPAGLLANLRVADDAGKTASYPSDATWRAAEQAEGDWTSPGFDDGKWAAAKVTAEYGQGPWNELKTSNASLPTFAAGIPEKVRVIYAPLSKPLRVSGLEGGVEYAARQIDPVNGTTTDLGAVKAEQDGSWTSPAPTGGGQDWVLVLERTGAQ